MKSLIYLVGMTLAVPLFAQVHGKRNARKT